MAKSCPERQSPDSHMPIICNNHRNHYQRSVWKQIAWLFMSCLTCLAGCKHLVVSGMLWKTPPQKQQTDRTSLELWGSNFWGYLSNIYHFSSIEKKGNNPGGTMLGKCIKSSKNRHLVRQRCVLLHCQLLFSTGIFSVKAPKLQSVALSGHAQWKKMTVHGLYMDSQNVHAY